VFGGYRPVIKTYDEFDDAGDIGGERRITFVAVVFTEGATVVMKFDGECFVDLVGGSADDDRSFGGVGFADFQLMCACKVGYFLQFCGTAKSLCATCRICERGVCW
jgi:hypothetical protein